MGFLDRLTKSFAKNEREVVRPAEGRSVASARLFTQEKTIKVVPVAGNSQHPVSEQAIPESATAVAVVEPPDMAESTDRQVILTAEPNRSGFFAEDFDQELNEVFESLVSQDASAGGQSAGGEMTADDQAVVEDLFADIAANYARPVKNFIFELRRGTATKEWIEICRPAMQGIMRAAEGMGLNLAAERMVDFEAALSLAQGSDQRVLSGEIRDLLLCCYQDLVEALPQAFVVGEEEQQREGIIINSLLMQIPDLGRVTVEKLYRAGLTSLSTLFLAKEDDLAVATGIPTWLSERICDKFHSYRAELEGNRDVADSGQRTRVSEMLIDLRRHNVGFERASEGEWCNPELASEKRTYRQQRQSCMLRLNVLLAEMGELDLVNELQKLSFERRIQRLEEYLMSPPATM
jgi:hypothetical protein